jgi:hypothetical protein
MLISFFGILFGIVMTVVLIKVMIYINKKIERRNFKMTPDEMERAGNLVKSIPDDIVEIHEETVTWFGIEKERSKLVFNCKFCGQDLQPKPDSNGSFTRDSWQCPNGCKPEK